MRLPSKAEDSRESLEALPRAFTSVKVVFESSLLVNLGCHSVWMLSSEGRGSARDNRISCNRLFACSSTGELVVLRIAFP